jgi:hypothetical protein
MSVQLGSHVFNARVHVPKVSDVRAIIDLQDVRACSTFNAYKTCEQVTTVRLQCSACPADHMQDTATVPGDAIGPSHATDRARCGRATGHDTLHALPKPSLAIPSHKNPN